jgi:hypothetical protein
MNDYHASVVEAILNIYESGGTAVYFTYSEHYGVELRFKNDQIHYYDGVATGGTFQPINNASISIRDMAMAMQKAANELTVLMGVVPWGNLETLGGIEKLAESLWIVTFANMYKD